MAWTYTFINQLKICVSSTIEYEYSQSLIWLWILPWFIHGPTIDLASLICCYTLLTRWVKTMAYQKPSIDLVGGLEHVFFVYWEFHHPNWLPYFSEGWLNHQPEMFTHPTIFPSAPNTLNSNVFRCQKTTPNSVSEAVWSCSIDLNLWWFPKIGLSQ